MSDDNTDELRAWAETVAQDNPGQPALACLRGVFYGTMLALEAARDGGIAALQVRTLLALQQAQHPPVKP